MLYIDAENSIQPLINPRLNVSPGKSRTRNCNPDLMKWSRVFRVDGNKKLIRMFLFIVAPLFSIHSQLYNSTDFWSDVRSYLPIEW